MEISVSIDNVDFKSVIAEDYDGTETIGDRVVSELVQIAVRGDKWNSVTQRVKAIREEEIRAAIQAELVEAMNTPFKKTNQYGEPTGAETTLREVIANEAREAMKLAGNRSPYRSDIPQHAQALWETIRNEAASAVNTVIKREVAEEAERIRQAMRDQAAAILADKKAK